MNPEIEKAMSEIPFEEVSRTNPYNLNVLPQGSKMVLHANVDEKTKGGVILTERAKEELRKARAENDSELYYVVAVSEAVAQQSGYKPGMWVLLEPGSNAQLVKIKGKEFILVDAYAVSGIIPYHEDDVIESLYKLPA